jgi:hypothetical protein
MHNNFHHLLLSFRLSLGEQECGAKEKLSLERSEKSYTPQSDLVRCIRFLPAVEMTRVLFIPEKLFKIKF